MARLKRIAEVEIARVSAATEIAVAVAVFHWERHEQALRRRMRLRRDPHAADFFFAFGLAAFGTTGASGVPSIEDRRPAVNV